MTDQAQNLRTLMQLSHSDTRVITVASGKGGVGKSSLALNLGIALSRQGRRPLIIDTDFGFSNIDVMLGVQVKHDLLDVIEGRCTVREAIETGLAGVQFISGGSGVYELLRMPSSQLMEVMDNLTKLEDVADTIIFDTGAGLSEHAMWLNRAAHETILVITPEPTSMVDAYALLKMLRDQGEKPHVSLVVNKVTDIREAQTVAQGFTRIAEKNLSVCIQSLGHITRDLHMSNAIKMQVPILISYPRCAAAADICTLAQRYLGQPPRIVKRPGVTGFLGYFLARKSAVREA